MLSSTQYILDAFERLSEEEKSRLALEIIRRTMKMRLPPLTDEELILNAEELFLEFDRRELADEQLRVGRWLTSSVVNGPGRRFVVWLQGCPFECKGCFNPEFRPRRGGTLMNIGELTDLILSTGGIEGVTFTGGEPFLQAQGLSHLARRVRSEGLSVVCYTGYTLDAILNDEAPFGRDLLRWTDVLIDGLYREEESAALLWRGSRNQRVHFPTQRYREWEPRTLREGVREVEIQVNGEDITVTGFPDADFWDKLREKLPVK